MPFTTSWVGSTDHDIVEAVDRHGVMGRGGTAIACWSRFTELHELSFHAVVGDGARELRFERLLAR